MTFGLPSWFKSRYSELPYEVPVWYPSHDQPDHREWIVTNGLGGYSSGTICGAHTRRYHGVLLTPLNPPGNRHVLLSRIDEVVTVDNTTYELSTNHWASGVVAPTGYKLMESFTILPSPTWVFALGSNYLIKQLVVPWGSNQALLGYFWLPDHDRPPAAASITLRFLTGFRSFHDAVAGVGGRRYVQSATDNGSLVWQENSDYQLNLSWSHGKYHAQEQWWWSYHWLEEAARGLPDQEDLFLAGTLSATLDRQDEIIVSAGPERQEELPSSSSFRAAVESGIKRHAQLLSRAALPRTHEHNLLVLACDQFLVKTEYLDGSGMSVIAGYPWFSECGRDAMISLPGLTMATRRPEESKQVLSSISAFMTGGLLPGRFSETSCQPDFHAADTTLWWAWALHQYYRATKDIDFIARQFPLLKEATRQYVEGTGRDIAVDPSDGLLRCGDSSPELTWMDAQVAGIPITPRSGKPVEVCALWYNMLEVLRQFASELGEDIGPFRQLSELVLPSLQKFWNSERQCLYDVLEPGNKPAEKPNDAVRPNQLLALSLPFRAFTKIQERQILTTVDQELLTPLGLRSLSPTDPGYQGRFGCGFARADQYHRDLSYHQGTVWPWLLGPYCEALLNLHGPLPETYAKIRILLQPLLNHLMEEGCLGSISEIFDGNSPHMPRGCFAQACAVAETMRILAMVLRA
jgi:4-alpha-glucanotransferase